MSTVRTLTLCGLLLGASAPAWSQVHFAGPEFQVSAGPNSSMRLRQPTAAYDASGRALLVWQDDQRGLRGIFLDDSGPAGSEIGLVANLGLPSFPGHGDVIDRKDATAVFNADGSFFLFWTEESDFLSSDIFYENRVLEDRDVFGQRFDATAHPVGTRFRVNSTAAGLQSRPRAVRASCLQAGPQPCGDGNILVAWEANDLTAAATGDGIFAQIYNPAGGKVGGEIRVSTNPGGGPSAHDVAVAADESGGFLVAWDAWGYRGRPDVFVRHLDRRGAPSGPPATLNSHLGGDQVRPAVTFASGKFLAVWQSPTGAPNRFRIYGQLLDASGARLGNQIPVSDGFDKYEIGPGVAASPSGDFFVTWAGWNGANDGSIFPRALRGAEVMARDGALFAPPIQISKWQTDYFYRTEVASGPGNRLLVTWEAFFQNRDAGLGISARRLAK